MHFCKWLSVILLNTEMRLETRNLKNNKTFTPQRSLKKKEDITETNTNLFTCNHNLWIHIIKANLVFTNHKLQKGVQIQSFWEAKCISLAQWSSFYPMLVSYK